MDSFTRILVYCRILAYVFFLEVSATVTYYICKVKMLVIIKYRIIKL